MQRHSRNPKIAKEARTNQPFCSKCTKTKDLHAHHVIALGDGGPDTVENLDVLCGSCHHDWHYSFEGKVSYADFMDYPTVSVLVGVVARSDCDANTFGQLKQQWSAIREFLHAIGPDA